MAARPSFYLFNPVARKLVINDRFNSPRNYSFAPTKLQKHEGIDIVALDAQGSPVAVLASQRGVVDQVGFSPTGYGNYVRIVHKWGPETYVTWYGHLSAATAQVGQYVKAGQKIGIAGTTGFSTGIHLHLTLQHIGRGLANYVVDDVVDPEPFLADSAPAFDEMDYVADVTIPDGTVMRAGQEFNKTWRVRNTGTTTWGTGHKIVFAKDDPMGAAQEFALPRSSIVPGDTADITVKLTAPTSTGTHRSTWQMRAPDGQMADYTMFTEIVVKGSTAVDQATYVSDVTIDDGTLVQPGATFVKTWRIRNTGTTIWNTGYTLRWVSDERMDGPDSAALPRAVKPTETVEVSVTLKAPQTSGRHVSTWKMHNAAGQAFDYWLSADIQVPQQHEEPGKLSEMRYVADVTIPDGTPVQPGQTFEKTWRVRNSGQTTWGTGYELAFSSGEQMGGPDSVALPAAKPGESVLVTVPMVAPTQPGIYRSNWKPRVRGKSFEFEIFALVEVVDPQALRDELSWVKDVTVVDGTAMKAGESFVKTWRVRNTGTSTWGSGYRLAFSENERMDGPGSVLLPAARPGDAVDVSVTLTAPVRAGLHTSTWKPVNAQGKPFDYSVFALIEVIDPSQTFDMLGFLRGDGRLYDLEFNWSGGGTQRVQTQVEGNKFYHVKYAEWEEFWSDEQFIYRGMDTSPGKGEVYILSENGQYGSAWIPRRMTVGAWFRRSPMVTFRRKSDGALISEKQGIHVTWITLETVHARYRLPSGIEIQQVAVLAAYEDQNGQPQSRPFERYYYAKKYGLVGWEGELGRAHLVREFLPGTLANLIRERITWM